MAKMIPELQDPSAIIAPEQVLYIALRNQLPSDYTVFHSYPWLRRWRGDRAKALVEGETDFLVLHPERGVLVLEVKGGDVDHDANGWFRHVASGRREIQNPFDQARRNLHALEEIVRDRSHGLLRDEDYVRGYAVAFTQVDYRGQLPADADPDIVITNRHLGDVRMAIERAFARWTQQPRPLSPGQFESLLGSVAPQFEFVRVLAPEVEAAAQQAMMLTATQTQAWAGLLEATPRALVQGPAGTGKTELALRSAVVLARGGRRTALLCYNKELALALRARLQLDPATRDLLDQRLDVFNFHGLASELAQRARMLFAPADGREVDQRFWDEEAPDLISQAIGVLEAEGQPAHYEALVVDEGQDFRAEWWYTLRMDLLATEDSPLQVFLDEHQSLWGKFDDSQFGPEWLRFRLKTNCRNTRRVAGFAAALAGVDAEIFKFAPEGVSPEVIRATDQSKQRDLALGRVRRLIESGLGPSQIVLIGPAAKEKGSLAGVREVANQLLVTSPTEWRKGRGVLVTTARSFKGLEAAAVVVYDLGALGRLFTDADLYVACTRATYKLDLIVHDEEMRRRLRQVN